MTSAALGSALAMHLRMPDGDGMRLSNPAANLSTQPDGLFVTYASLQSGRVRRVPGRNPQPVVLDTHLRIPMDCRLLADGALKPWIATLDTADPDRKPTQRRPSRHL